MNSVTRAETGGAPRTFLWNLDHLNTMKQAWRDGDPELRPAVDRLLRQAKSALQHGPYSVVDKEPVPPSGDKHDYYELDPKYWPNPNTEDGFPWIQTGTTNPNTDYDAEPLDQLGIDVELLSLAYFLKDDKSYAQHAAFLIRTWFLEAATAMNPNMTYGKTNPNTLAGGFPVVRATLDFIRIFDSAGLLESSSAWTRKDREALQKWAANFVKWLNTHAVARKELKATNNHGTYYDLLIGLMSLYSGDKATLRSSVLRYQTRMLTHIASDGSQPIEMKRSNNLFYHVLNADGMVMLARLSEQIPDVDLLFYKTEKGGSIQKALKFLVPYITAQKTWPFFPDKPKGVDFRGAYVLYERAASIYGDNEYVVVSRLIPGNFADNRVNVAYPITHIPSDGQAPPPPPVPPEDSSGCVISDGSHEATLQPGTVVSSVRQYLGDKGVWVTSYGSASASIYKWTSFSGFITEVNAGETWNDGTFNSIECAGDQDGQNQAPPPEDDIPAGGDGCVISDGSHEATLQPGTVVSSVRQYLGDKGVWVTSYGSASASIYKWTSFSGFITDVNAGETWDTGTFNSIECR